MTTASINDKHNLVLSMIVRGYTSLRNTDLGGRGVAMTTHITSVSWPTTDPVTEYSLHVTALIIPFGAYLNIRITNLTVAWQKGVKLQISDIF